jgi:hypothetical protein
MSELATDIGESYDHESVPVAPLLEACRYVAREYSRDGEGTGYALAYVGSRGGRYLFMVSASDGARFHVVSDRYGVSTDVRTGETFADAISRGWPS